MAWRDPAKIPPVIVAVRVESVSDSLVRRGWAGTIVVEERWREVGYGTLSVRWRCGLLRLDRFRPRADLNIILLGIEWKDEDGGENPTTDWILEWAWSNITIANVALIEELKMMPDLLSDAILVNEAVLSFCC